MNAIQCDYCGKFAANPLYRSASDTLIPAGWLLIAARYAKSQSQDLWEFCSRDCVSQHFAKPEAA